MTLATEAARERAFRDTVCSTLRGWPPESPQGFYTGDQRNELGALIKAGLARRKAAGQAIGRKPGSKDRKPRKREGYVTEQARRRAAKQTRQPDQ